MSDEPKARQSWYQELRAAMQAGELKVMGWLGGREADGLASKSIEAGKSGHHFDQLHWAMEAEARIPVHLFKTAKAALGFGGGVQESNFKEFPDANPKVIKSINSLESAHLLDHSAATFMRTDEQANNETRQIVEVLKQLGADNPALDTSGKHEPDASKQKSAISGLGDNQALNKPGLIKRVSNKISATLWKWAEWQEGKEATDTLKQSDAAYLRGDYIEGLKLGVKGNKQAVSHVLEEAKEAGARIKNFITGGKDVATNDTVQATPHTTKAKDGLTIR